MNLENKVSVGAGLYFLNVLLESGLSCLSYLTRLPAHLGADTGDKSRNDNGERHSDDREVEDGSFCIRLCDSISTLGAESAKTHIRSYQ